MERNCLKIPNYWRRFASPVAPVNYISNETRDLFLSDLACPNIVNTMRTEVSGSESSSRLANIGVFNGVQQRSCKSKVNFILPERYQQDHGYDLFMVAPAGTDGHVNCRESSLRSGFVAVNLSWTSTIRKLVGCDFATIDIEDLGVDDKPMLTYMEMYLTLMYHTGLSPYRPEKASGGCWGDGQFFSCMQMVIFWSFTLFSTLQTLAKLKYYCLDYLTYGGLENFTNFGFHIMNTCTKVYSAYLFSQQKQKFDKMLKSMNKLQAFCRNRSKAKESKHHPSKVTLLALTSFTVSILSVIFRFGIIGWSPREAILHQSTSIGVAIYTWTSEEYHGNGTDADAMFEEFGSNLTTRNTLLGITGIAMDLCNRIMTDAMGDLILMVAITLHKQIIQLAQDVDNPANDAEPLTTSIFESVNGQWNHYRLLKQAVDDTNDTFDCLLKYMHINNIMLFVFVVMNIADGWMSFFVIVFHLYNIVKTSCTYRIATSASEKNETFRKWIRRLAWKNTSAEFTSKANLVLDQMKEEPLGLGKGQFLIDESFLFRFFGTVGSVFVLQAQSRESAQQ